MSITKLFFIAIALFYVIDYMFQASSVELTFKYVVLNSLIISLLPYFISALIPNTTVGIIGLTILAVGCFILSYYILHFFKMIVVAPSVLLVDALKYGFLVMIIGLAFRGVFREDN